MFFHGKEGGCRSLWAAYIYTLEGDKLMVGNFSETPSQGIRSYTVCIQQNSTHTNHNVPKRMSPVKIKGIPQQECEQANQQANNIPYIPLQTAKNDLKCFLSAIGFRAASATSSLVNKEITNSASTHAGCKMFCGRQPL